MLLDYEWARAKAIRKFNLPTSRINDRILRALEEHGWIRQQIMDYLQDGWCVCEVAVIRDKPRQIEVRRVYTKD